MKIVCIIPARLASTRFPRKVLAKLHGKTMLEHVFLAAKNCPEFSDIYIAVDSEETAREVEAFQGKWLMTSPFCSSGTDRIIECIETHNVAGDVFVNWQADEPFVQREMIKDLLQGVLHPEQQVWTLKKKAKPEEIANPNVVKVVTDRFGRALYFSRSPIPFDRDHSSSIIYKHIGLYAYRREALLEIKNFSINFLAEVEKLEQLAFLENGLPINVYPTDYESIGIDTQEDLQRALLLWTL